MSMLQQGAVAEALKYTYCDLPEALQGLIISHVSGDRKLTNIAKSIINTSKDDPYLAFRLCRKECSLYPDLAKYLASAVFIGLLDEKVFPRWKTVENPLPIYPTRYSGVCKPGAPVTLTIDQDMQLTEVVRDMITSSPMAIKVEVEVGKKASVTWQII